MDINLSTYSSKDLYICAFLQTKGILPLRLELRGKEYWFIFPNKNGKCDDLIENYWSEKEAVNVKKYSDAIKAVKQRIYSLYER